MDEIGNAALIVEGGAMRGVFSCGILDHFLSVGFSPFDSFWGVSAGASNLTAYLANMPERNLKIYTDYSCRKEFIRFDNILHGQDIMDLDWLWDVTLSELGLDLAKIEADGRPFFMGVTNRDTGKAVYWPATEQSLIETMKASSALPVLYKNGVKLSDGNYYFDGGVSDSIPVEEVIRRGAKRIMILRSQQYDYRKSAVKFPYLVKKMLAKTPQLVEPLLDRAEKYNASIDLIRNPPVGVEIVEVCPPESFQLKRLTRDPKPLFHGYNLGKLAAIEVIEKWGHVNGY